MKNQQKLSLVSAVIPAIVVLVLFASGKRERTARVWEPHGEPVPMARTVSGVHDLMGETLNIAKADVSETAPPILYVTGDEGNLHSGIEKWDSRFIDNGNGTVTDHLTGLVWLKDANCFQKKPWGDALRMCETLADGLCGLRDGSSPGDWHLPDVRQLHSLFDYGGPHPSLPSRHPFEGVHISSCYWSSTSFAGLTSRAWCVDMNFDSLLGGVSKDNDKCVWPVRAAN